ncbi:MAG TPA: hypothetical protein VG842_02655 [Sediminibacterium sp.]|nr:hypothetical protein [Sediminibacterium sp.]
MRWQTLLAWPGCCLLLGSCSTTKQMHWPVWQGGGERQGGTAFYHQVAAAKWRERDSLAVLQIEAGNIPDRLRRFQAVHSSYTDSSGKTYHATFYVARDYLSLGTNADWARIPMTPMAAQSIADSFHCFLPTRKMVDLVYEQSRVKLEPVPMYAYRDSSVTMWQHHLIVEGQRKGRKGLIAGIKKDVVISGKLKRDSRPNREAIYGWHQLDGKPIQPLYTGHVNWWVDYSHGIRLVYRKIRVNHRWMDYTTLLHDPILQKLICDEEWCDCERYPY